jgi:triple functional domain protein
MPDVLLHWRISENCKTVGAHPFQVTVDGQVVYEAAGRQAGNPAADYSEGASHVLAVIHQILNHHRTLEQKWHAKKIKLHQRLALRLFQEDVKQVCI